MLSRLTRSARKLAETIELAHIRRSTGDKKDTREGMIAGVNHLMKSLERAMGMEDATKSCQAQKFFCKKLRRRQCLPDTTFLGGSGSDSREELVGVSLEDGTLSSTRFSVTSSSQSRRDSNRFPCARSMSSFLFLCF